MTRVKFSFSIRRSYSATNRFDVTQYTADSPEIYHKYRPICKMANRMID